MASGSALRWSDLIGRRVGVFGVGREGRATIARLHQLGVEPAAVVDDRPAEGSHALATGNGGRDALARCEVVVKSPGISRYRPDVLDLEGGGVAVVGGLGLWLEEIGGQRVIGITGTKGKSTTTSVAGHLAASLGTRVWVGGNLGDPPWDPGSPDPAEIDLWILEISSYQATDLWSSPAVAGLTSLHPDHLDWHRSVEAYYRDKLALASRPGLRVIVANAEDERLRGHADLLRGPVRWIAADPEATWTRPLGLRGRHNVVNALIAAACLEEMQVPGAADAERLEDAAAGYHPLPHRLETVAVADGIEYVDDSLSTNVLPTLEAMKVFEGRPLALIAGGYDRDIDYVPLADFVVRRSAPTLVCTVPQNGGRIGDVVTAAGGTAVECESVAAAVATAARWAPAGGVVLLSPAAPSYGIFHDYRERGAAFRAAVGEIAGS